MHNRMVRGDILTSERVNQIASDQGCEVFYRRLLNVVDDFGHYPADTRILRAALYPMRLDSVTEDQISGYVSSCKDAGLIVAYDQHGKSYLEVLRFRQRLNRMTNKYPPPDVSHSDSRIPPPEVEVEVEVEAELNTCASGDAPDCSATPSLVKRKTPASDTKYAQADEWFRQWWDIFWLKRGRKKALEIFRRVVLTPETFEAVMNGTRAQLPEMLAREPRFKIHGSTFLFQERWNDEAAPAKSNGIATALEMIKKEKSK